MFTIRIGSISTPAELIKEVGNLIDHCTLRPSEITATLVVIAGVKIGTCSPRHMTAVIRDATTQLLTEAVALGVKNPCKNCMRK